MKRIFRFITAILALTVLALVAGSVFYGTSNPYLFHIGRWEPEIQ